MNSVLSDLCTGAFLGLVFCGMDELPLDCGNYGSDRKMKHFLFCFLSGGSSVKKVKYGALVLCEIKARCSYSSDDYYTTTNQ